MNTRDHNVLGYPARLIKQQDGSVLVRFPDIPEAITDGKDRGTALRNAADCLLAALGGYVEAHRPLPVSSLVKRGQKRIVLPPLAAAKLALYQSLLESGGTRVQLAARLGVSEGAVRRLLDLDHRSHIGQIDKALIALGKRLVVDVCNAA